MTAEVGRTAPDFKLPITSGETKALSDYKGQHIVLYFYPKDNTPGCTTEACDFRDLTGELEEQGAVVLGVSPDSIKKHQNFSEKFSLPFPLFADENNEASEAYGVWQLKKNFGKEYMGVVRSTFVINKDFQLVKEWRKVSVKGHAEEVLEYINELNSGQ
ncbi:thioredoxin-dependent thiol peroxidase [Alkalicoccobacillus porphyridii]|uniref:thioredoxin-dependent peroxiredoxin n=1 Tax=Alkalicoccobacillus porphyridii TaxID=2597270 RepID=A0A553ZUT8_9BACI|nr:thioredoxin-dependent thiol peroxidase [Alkalicoccobacillus porphyridii]TSB45183.1 thioredoxin-dependent thiol peroxidase [Alkalicoccobacillus porphyridii]